MVSATVEREAVSGAAGSSIVHNGALQNIFVESLIGHVKRHDMEEVLKSISEL
jgi:hypothetical protein